MDDRPRLWTIDPKRQTPDYRLQIRESRLQPLLANRNPPETTLYSQVSPYPMVLPQVVLTRPSVPISWPRSDCKHHVPPRALHPPPHRHTRPLSKSLAAISGHLSSSQMSLDRSPRRLSWLQDSPPWKPTRRRHERRIPSPGTTILDLVSQPDRYPISSPGSETALRGS